MADFQSIVIRRQVVEQTADFIDDLCHRRLRSKRVFGKHNVEPMSQGALSDERDVFLTKALPVAAVDEYPGWRIGVLTEKQVETLAWSLAVTKVPLASP